ncbi:MAG: HAD family phosphatase [Magnetococcales bacterium]|nr:HAD family phosphatase [Magnetococcales bacterium]MBF0149087.1 HAD family phosphatase [Magnetococcales bacterium]MBF0630221.1 HAD family phosphatase [Magnetococcales bacterium]
MMLAGAEAVIFDMDGVLWQSDRVHAEAYARVLTENHLPVVDYATLAGRRTDQVFRQMLMARGRLGDEGEVARLTRQKQAHALRMLAVHPPIDPDGVEVVRTLSCRMKVALASSASSAGVELFLRTSGLAQAFSVVLSGEDVRQAKPDPEIYLLALEKLGVVADRAVVIEDSLNGIVAARRAGIAVILKKDSSQRDLSQFGEVHAVIDHLRDLL